MKKNKTSKRIIILMLCFALVFSQSILVLANEDISTPAVTDTIEDQDQTVIPEEITLDDTVTGNDDTAVIPPEQPQEPVLEDPSIEEDVDDIEEPADPDVEAEEPVEGEEPEDADPGDVPEEDLEGTEEEVEEEPVEEPTPITVFNYESEEVIVVVTLTNPEDLPEGVELVVTPIQLTGEQEIGIGVAATDDKIILKEIHAFDIKFMLNGEEVQPGASVKVTITLPGMEMDEETAVYHIDENDQIENMAGAVNEDGNVEFDTTHFSTYVVVPTEDGTDNINGAAGYGTLRMSVQEGVLEYDKTATVDDWDERTYDIEIMAKSILTETTTRQIVSDGMLVVDMSGSMLRTLQGTTYAGGEEAQVRVGKYNAVKGSLDKSHFYYLQTSNSSASFIPFKTEADLNNGYDTTSRVMAYFDYEGTEADGWYYYNKQYRYTIPKAGTTYDPTAWVKMADNSTWYVFDWEALRINTLKNMVVKYMNAVAENSPGSYMGMTTFYSAGYKVLDYEPIAEGNSIKLDVLQKFAALRPQREWCTHPDTGLEPAFKEMVSENSSYNAKTGVVTVGDYNAAFSRKVNGKDVNKYLILFSDGEPDSSGNDAVEVPKIEKATLAWAKAFRDAGVKVYTVAFAYNNSDSTWLEDIASPGCTYTADTVEELEEVLTQIKESETSLVDYVTVDVKDYVDDRFVVLDDNGDPITTSGVQIHTTGYDGDTAVTRTGTVYFDNNGRQYIIWADQKAMKEGSTWTVKVQAKEDYIGGNDVDTNIDGVSVIDAGDYGTFDLPDPVVNVKATMEIGNNNLYIYKGTTAPIEYSADADPLTMYKAVQDAIAAYTAPGYAGVDAADFIVKWYTDAACTTEIAMEDIDDDPVNGETNYYLKFTYDPGDPSTESNDNTTKGGTTYISGRDDGSDNGIVEAVNVNDSTKQYGIYNIKLWQIVKRSSSGQNIPLENVEFKIEENTTGLTYYGKSDANGFVALYTDSACTTLAEDTPIGTYTLSEIKTVTGYTLNDETWTITAAYANEPDITDVTSSTGEAVLTETSDGLVISYIYVNNPMVYELPGTGGFGIYGSIIAGIALLMGGSLVVYRRRCMEVLRRK